MTAMPPPLPRKPVVDPPAATAFRPDPAQRLAPKARRQSHHGLYAAAWAAMGLIAGGYAFTLLLRNDAGSLVARGDGADTARTQADVSQLQQKVGQLESDMARVKLDQAQADEREKQLVQRVGGVESRVESFSVQIAQASATVAAAAKIAKPTAAQSNIDKAGARIATGTLPPADAAKQRDVAQARQAAAPQPDPVVDTQSGILLARGPSLDALRLSWNLLNERHKGTLKSFEPRVVEVEPGTYQLIAGPMPTPAEALKVCAALKARGVACQPSDYKGSAL